MEMASNDRLPAELDCTNLAKDWPSWKRSFLMYMMATGKMEEPEPKKIATFLWLIGSRAMDIYNTLFPNDGTTDGILGNQAAAVVENENEQHNDDVRTLDIILKAFDDYCIPRKNTTMESFKFNSIVQKERQSFADFETELRKQIQFCEFNCWCGLSYEERMLKDRIIIAVHDKKLQLKLLDGKSEPLKNVIETCKVFEAANANKVFLDRNTGQSNVQMVVERQQPDSINAVTRRCYNCGEPFSPSHLRHCKANEHVCRCGRKGHFERFCKSKGKPLTSENKKDSKPGTSGTKPGINDKAVAIKSLEYKWSDSGNILDFIDGNSISKSCRIFRLNSIAVIKKKRWTKAYQIGNQTIVFKLDTGSDVDCIPMKMINQLSVNVDNKSNDFPVFDYSGNKVKIFGTAQLKCFDLDRKTEHRSIFLVVDDGFEPLLGLESCIKFGLIKRADVNAEINSIVALPKVREDFLESNHDIFNGLGKFPGKFNIQLREDAKPVLRYKKRIPLSLIDKLKVEIQNMIQAEIISPVEHPTEWVNNLQIVEKPNGKLRICLDPKPLNECIQREHFLIPTIDDFTSKLTNKKVFSILDLSSGFWHMELDNESSDLTTFMTPFGRFKFNRVPFGLNCAPEMFQRKMVEIFGDIPGVLVYFDDVGIFAESEEEHDGILATVCERARDNGIKFNPEKLQYRKSEVKFMGHILSNGQIKPDGKYREAILKIKKPENKNDVMRLLGLFKYLAKFIPNLSKLSAALRELTRNDVEFSWTDKHEMEMRNLLNIITSDPVLVVYDPKKPVTVQTDASKDGLGCVLIQEGHPVAYASRTLSKSEQKWAQIEKELLAIVFACQRFHFFLYGREFTVESDHKPLETLVKRDIDNVTARLQRMFMSLLRYPRLRVVYKPGRDMLVADCLSRAQLPDCRENTELTGIIHSLAKSVCMTRENYNKYRTVSEHDEKHMRICEYVENGWPHYHHLDNFGREFYKYKSELHFETGLLFCGNRLVVPLALQRPIMKMLHAPHLGIEKTLARARMLYYWPGMSSQIKEIVSTCATCEKFKRNNQKEELVQEEAPGYPFHIAAMDLFEYAGRDFISIIDSYSGYLIVEQLNSKTSGHIIGKLASNFNKLGYPTIIRCDNSPFSSAEFEQFASEHNIQIKFSSPRYPQSNGLAEKGVAIAKNILKRCYEEHETGEFPYRIFEYNLTPIASLKLSPSQLFFGRLLRSKLPVLNSSLMRNTVSESDVQEKIKEKREKQKYYYDRNARAMSVLSVGDLVIFKKTGKDWHHGTIMGNVNDRSYIIQDSFGNYYRRNRRFIAKTTRNDFNASDLLYEEHIRKNVINAPESLREIQIVPPPVRGEHDTSGNEPTNCEVEDELLPVALENTDSSDGEFVSAGSGESEAESENGNETPSPSGQEPNVTRSRSGRIIRPPKRFTFNR